MPKLYLNHLKNIDFSPVSFILLQSKRDQRLMEFAWINEIWSEFIYEIDNKIDSGNGTYLIHSAQLLGDAALALITERYQFTKKNQIAITVHTFGSCILKAK